MSNDKTGKVCCFFGCEDYSLKEGFLKRLSAEIEQLISNGYDTFYFSRLGKFDYICYQTVSRLKEKYTHIKRIYMPIWYGDKNIEPYKTIYNEYDRIEPAKKEPPTQNPAIDIRNKMIIDKSDFCFFYVYRNGGANTAMAYARQKGKLFINTALWDIAF